MQNGEEKIKAYLGFSLKSGKIALGADDIDKLKKGAYLILADADIGATAKKRLCSAAERLNCPLYFSKEGGLGAALCRPAVKAAALKDKNLAKATQEAVSGNEKWKLYSGGEI
ncbi:MAG: hypothetical protein ACI4SH_02390 [Candidatus Scatosoma sp.]